MRYSKLFGKTLNEAPKDATTINHKLLSQAGFVEQLMAGVYTYLPLGLRVLRNIEQIVRDGMNELGANEILMPVLHPSANWKQTQGWENIDVLFKVSSRTDKDYALGQSEEEVVTPLAKSRIQTYKDLPMAAYQIHWKYRDELRSKSGIFRGIEFLMKDLYSFHESQEDFDQYYQKAKEIYLKIFTKLGLTAKVTEASGGSFTQKISYEFMVLTDAGEDDILYCDDCDFCVNVEIAKAKEGESCPSCKKTQLKKARASEAGNVFDLGQKYSKDFDVTFTAKDGTRQHPIMGCYGIGVSRVMGIIVEKHFDDKGIIWPESVAPFKMHLVGLDLQDENIKNRAEEVYKMLNTKYLPSGRHGEIQVLFDDRIEKRAGEKFADADLIGIPHRIIVSKKTGDKIEYKGRAEKESKLLTIDELIKQLQ